MLVVLNGNEGIHFNLEPAIYDKLLQEFVSIVQRMEDSAPSKEQVEDELFLRKNKAPLCYFWRCISACLLCLVSCGTADRAHKNSRSRILGRRGTHGQSLDVIPDVLSKTFGTFIVVRVENA